MWAGVPISKKRKATRITDRREAILKTCAEASPGDIILIAGKGHEPYQEIAGTKYPFSDKAEVIQAFMKRG
jgi:UDP-N-acetylmuramoyl-L-alanyl-D-glutamate--2,6-diaminopimelate ligase